MNEITIGDKVYVSAKRAAEITGYARDYVGQLCREGHVDAKMVGRSWYVYEPSIRAHRFGPETGAAQKAEIVADLGSEEPNEADMAVEESAEESISAQPATASDWQAAKYTSEEPTPLPELSAASLEELLPPAEETLTDMQAAWREWFEQKQNILDTPEIESPEVIDARNESYEAESEDLEAAEEPDAAIEEEEIEEDTVEEVVPIHHIAPEPSPVYAPTPDPRMDIRREVAPAPREADPIARYSGEYAVPQAPHGRIIEERVITKKGKAGSKAKKVRAKRTSNAPIIAVFVGISLIAITIALIGTGYASRYLRTLPSENNPVIEFLVGTQKFSR